MDILQQTKLTMELINEVNMKYSIKNKEYWKSEIIIIIF